MKGRFDIKADGNHGLGVGQEGVTSGFVVGAEVDTYDGTVKVQARPEGSGSIAEGGNGAETPWSHIPCVDLITNAAIAANDDVVAAAGAEDVFLIAIPASGLEVRLVSAGQTAGRVLKVTVNPIIGPVG